MKYLLDSNIIIALTMNADDRVVRRAGECFEGDIVTSAIAIAEVALGSVRGKPPGFAQLEAFLEEVPLLDFDLAAARVYADLPFKRRSYDRLIAAQALSQNLIMVTDNEKDFADIPGLKVENWTQ
ncbi:type II toxin-antitoxin system VapC family toxin [Blastomonas aquatica]|uniref:Twitching motility protein PilT n=1 Tax=Blastomonas aquatica TaxID=1510276 RepID=A0ABQ1J220_9SPHN|nr:type II toxin-antitoxin system VapC family toxin [Blastomonas aquatica]GGB58166.1 twitching motility protein PilT [Blastomonas aquatica]